MTRSGACRLPLSLPPGSPCYCLSWRGPIAGVVQAGGPAPGFLKRPLVTGRR